MAAIFLIPADGLDVAAGIRAWRAPAETGVCWERPGAGETPECRLAPEWQANSRPPDWKRCPGVCGELTRRRRVRYTSRRGG